MKNAECLHTVNVTKLRITGKFLIIGGEDSPNDCVVYDVVTKQHTHWSKPNTEREAATSVKVGSRVYIIGGWRDDAGKSCEMLDLNDESKWSVMANMLEHRIWCRSGFLSDHIYVTGGLDMNYEILSSCEKFDIHNNKWMRINDMLCTRAEHGTVVCNDLLYCIGGYDDSKCLSSCECYDVRSDAWNEIAPLNQARCGLTCVELNGNIYAIGGFAKDQDLSTVERFNPAVGKWENIASLQHARYLSSACVVENKIFVIGGRNGQENLKSVEVYDPTSNVWTIAFETVNPVCDATVVAL